MARNNAAVHPLISEAILSEKLRIRSILTSAEAEGRAKLAMTLALDSALTAEAATDLLKVAAREDNDGSRFMAAMAAEGPLEIDGYGARSAPEDTKAKRLAELKDAANHVRVAKYGLPAKA